MIGPIRRYTRWLHTKWPAGVVENLPQVGPDGGSVPGHAYRCEPDGLVEVGDLR